MSQADHESTDRGADDCRGADDTRIAGALAMRPRGSGVFGVTLSPAWYQGRGIYGGLVSALLLKAASSEVEARDHHIRTANTHFCASPVAGEATVQTRRIRQGGSTTWMAATLSQAGAVMATWTGLFAADRTRDEDYNAIRLEPVPPPKAVPLMPQVPMLPTFTRGLELRMCLGDPPLSGSAQAMSGGWVRPRSGQVLDAPLAALLIDAWPPAFYMRATSARPAATVSLNTTFLERLPRAGATGEESSFLRVRGQACAGGYEVEDNHLFAEDGTPLLVAQQVVAVIK